tara:strand:- start:598 stop:981 length:384 start_codon:yes stop_codon:yes gene_type:complete
MREMTDRPSFPLTEAEYKDIIMNTEDGIRAETVSFLMVHRDTITDIVFQFSTRAACEMYWGSHARAWTEEGRNTIQAVVKVIGCNVQSTLRMLNDVYIPTDAYIAIRDLVKTQYTRWRPPSETYLCM